MVKEVYCSLQRRRFCEFSDTRGDQIVEKVANYCLVVLRFAEHCRSILDSHMALEVALDLPQMSDAEGSQPFASPVMGGALKSRTEE
jgi:hypothetical protein